jgi:hypothetical protein
MYEAMKAWATRPARRRHRASGLRGNRCTEDPGEAEDSLPEGKARYPRLTVFDAETASLLVEGGSDLTSGKRLDFFAVREWRLGREEKGTARKPRMDGSINLNVDVSENLGSAGVSRCHKKKDWSAYWGNKEWH